MKTRKGTIMRRVATMSYLEASSIVLRAAGLLLAILAALLSLLALLAYLTGFFAGGGA